MKTDNFSLRRFGMLVRAEFLINRKIWMLTFSIYFFFVALLVINNYFLEEFNLIRVITDFFSIFTSISLIASIFLSKMGINRYVNKNKVIVVLITPASRREKYFTLILFCLILPLFILAFLPFVGYAFFGVDDQYLFNAIGWYMILITVMVTVNLMPKGFLRFFSTLISVILIFIFFRYMQDVFLLTNWQVMVARCSVVSVIALISSWYLFKSYSIDRI